MITVDEAKLQVNIRAEDPTYDEEIQSYIDATTAVVERQVGEVVTPRSITERHDVSLRGSLALQHRPVLSLTTVARADGTQTWNVADLDVDASTGLVRVESGALLDGLLVITYQAGYNTIPPNWSLAARFIVQHLWKSQRGSSGVRMGGMTADATATALTTVPRDVWMLLGSQPPVVA